jgi:hypothetical protein
MSKISYTEGVVMAHREKRAWIRLVVAVVGYGVYMAAVLTRAGGRPLTQVRYADLLLWVVDVSIVTNVVVEMVAGFGSPKEARAADVRDREIGRRGDYVGQSFLVIGAVAAMLMAIANWDRFWIANVIYLGFTLSAILGGITKIGMYHGRLS